MTSQFPANWIPTGQVIQDLPSFIKQRESSVVIRRQTIDGFEYDFLQLEDETHAKSFYLASGGMKVAQLPIHRNQNRYSSILPFDKTRIHLPPTDNPKDTYMNGNFVVDESFPCKGYLAVQGPLRHTRKDFWRMIWHYKCPVIVMLTRTSESGREKCSLYWPLPRDDPINSVNSSKVVNHDHTVFRKFDNIMVKAISTSLYRQNPQIILRKFLVSDSTNSKLTPIQVTQIHFTGWSDFTAPSNNSLFQQVLQCFQEIYDKKYDPILPNPSISTQTSNASDSTSTNSFPESQATSSQINDKENITISSPSLSSSQLPSISTQKKSYDLTKNPFQSKDSILDKSHPLYQLPVIHCSAGVGRTGTFMGSHILLRRLAQFVISNSPPASSTPLLKSSSPVPQKTPPSSPRLLNNKLRKKYTVNIFQTAKTLRKFRANLIYNPVQYRFVHEVLYDSAISAGIYPPKPQIEQDLFKTPIRR